MIGIFGKMFAFGIKAAWGILKMFISFVLLPVILIGLLIGGLIYIAFPILIIIAIVSLVMTHRPA